MTSSRKSKAIVVCFGREIRVRDSAKGRDREKIGGGGLAERTRQCCIAVADPTNVSTL